MSTTTLVDSRLAAADRSRSEVMRRAARRRRYIENTAAAVLSCRADRVDAPADLQHRDDLARGPQRCVQRRDPRRRCRRSRAIWVVFTQGYWYLEHFWHQFGNSVYVGAAMTFLTLLIASATSFSISRMRIRHGWLVSNAALLTYVIPASFLAIPFYRIMQNYGLTNNLWSVIAAMVTFATPYAMFIFQQYGRSIPIELDESARIDGASPLQIYLRIYLPLMAPALVAVGTYALLLAWNEYLYQFLMLSDKRSMTVPVALAAFLNSDEAPWNYMMATAIVYALPPVVDLLLVPPPDDRRPDDGRRQGLRHLGP